MKARFKAPELAFGNTQTVQNQTELSRSWILLSFPNPSSETYKTDTAKKYTGNACRSFSYN